MEWMISLKPLRSVTQLSKVFIFDILAGTMRLFSVIAQESVNWNYTLVCHLEMFRVSLCYHFSLAQECAVGARISAVLTRCISAHIAERTWPAQTGFLLTGTKPEVLQRNAHCTLAQTDPKLERISWNVPKLDLLSSARVVSLGSVPFGLPC